MMALELEEVTKLHTGSPPVSALTSVSMRVEEGEFVAVVGPSGSGKSTLLAIAGTLERPTSGHVAVGGRRVEEMSDDQLSGVRAGQIGFVFQQFFLVPTLSTLDNVANGLLYLGVRARERRLRATEALERVHLEHRSSHKPGELSGGECQRAAIARAIVRAPRIILADEPTGNVDTVQGAEILDLLFDLNERGSTIVVITHNPEISDAIPRRISLRDGRILTDTGPLP